MPKPAKGLMSLSGWVWFWLWLAASAIWWVFGIGWLASWMPATVPSNYDPVAWEAIQKDWDASAIVVLGTPLVVGVLSMVVWLIIINRAVRVERSAAD